MSVCLVSVSDYKVHWKGGSAKSQQQPSWEGVERRSGLRDRRAPGHDRRWDGTVGRRRRLADRRKNS